MTPFYSDLKPFGKRYSSVQLRVYMRAHPCGNHVDFGSIEQFQHSRMFPHIFRVFNIKKIMDSDMTAVRDVSWDIVTPAA